MNDVLKAAGWGDAAVAELAGDASTRKYWRVTRADDSAMLMHDPGGSIPAFVNVAEYLLGHGLSAPRILHRADPYLLIEDLGDALFAQICAANPDLETPLYIAAVEALIDVQAQAPLADLPRATPERLADLTGLAFDFYLNRATGQSDNTARDACIAAFQQTIARHANDTSVTMLRDYHAENLLWLPDRSGTARVGLLDFQDAWAGHPAYDLVSVLQDARRDVSPDAVRAAMDHYLTRTGTAPEPFEAAYAILGALRNLRILGVFVRLFLTRGKPHYVDLIPRVWNHLQTDLNHPALSEIRAIVSILPTPTEDILQRLKTPSPAL